MTFAGTGSASADPILDKADGFLKSGRAEAAAAIYKAYLQEHPTAVRAELALADIAMRNYEYPKAQSILEKALAQHPESAETAAMLGRLFQLWSNSPSGKPADNTRDYRALANEHFTQARTLGPTNPMVLSAIADWEIQQNDLVSANRDLEQALRISPAYIPALQGMIRFDIKTKDLSRARNAAMHALDLDPENSMTYFLTAQLMGLADRPAEAVKYALKSEQLDYGRLPERDYFLATQYEKLGDSGQAIHYYEILTGYTPKEAQIWMKLGDLYDRNNQSAQSLSAYQKALALNPDIINGLVADARETTRAEKVELGLMQWRRILALQPKQPETVDEAWSAIAGLHALSRFLAPEQPDAQASRDLSALEQALAANPQQPNRQLDRAKILMAAQPSMSPATQQTLEALSHHTDPAIAGEAAFLLGQYDLSTRNLEDVDGLSEEEYTRLADRLFLDQELVFSRVFYQRAFELNRQTDLQTVLKRIQAKQTLASQKVDAGNTLFNAKKYKDALAQYQEGARIYREWDNVYLRLGDTYEQLHQWPQAKQAYDTAIALSPSLMESQGFSKNYNRLKKKAASSKKTATQ